MNTNGLIVGLAVGVPSLAILVIVLWFWVRAQRREKHDDSNIDDIDIGLRDNGLFDHFEEELNKPYRPQQILEHTPQHSLHKDSPDKSETSNDKSSTTITGSEKPFSSGPDLNGSSSTIEGRGKAPRPSHSKTPSSYDFYDAFIPVMPGTASPSPNVESTGQESIHTASTTSSIPREVSLGNLAKQLHAPQFFEKLPTRLPSVTLMRAPQVAMKNHNSSADLIFSDSTGAINDHFTYEATTIDVGRERRREIQDDESFDEPRGSHVYGAFTRRESPFVDNLSDNEHDSRHSASLP